MFGTLKWRIGDFQRFTIFNGHLNDSFFNWKIMWLNLKMYLIANYGIFDFHRLDWLSIEIKPEICKLFKNTYRPFHMKEHMRIIDKNQKSGSRPRNLRRRNAFLIFWHSNFAAVATATWWPEIQNFFLQ